MPYKIRKVNKQQCYRVYNPKTKKIYAKCTTKEKALKQIKFLMAYKNNPKFRKTLKKSSK
jgi:hypothetical protein